MEPDTIRDPTKADELRNAVFEARRIYDIAVQNNREAQLSLRTAQGEGPSNVAEQAHRDVISAEAKLEEAVSRYDEYLNPSAYPAASVPRSADDEAIDLPASRSESIKPAAPVREPAPSPRVSERRSNVETPHPAYSSRRRINWSAILLIAVLGLVAIWAYSNRGQVARWIDQSWGDNGRNNGGQILSGFDENDCDEQRPYVDGQRLFCNDDPYKVDVNGSNVKLIPYFSEGVNPTPTPFVPGADPEAEATTAPPVETQRHFPPVLFDGQSCPPEQSPCTMDVSPNGAMTDILGRNVMQVSIIWGVDVRWNGQSDQQHGRCEIVMVPPNNFLKDVTIVDGRWETYNVDATRVFPTSDEDHGWLYVLVMQRIAEQADAAHFSCPNWEFGDIQVWTSNEASPPCNVKGFNNCEGGSDPSGATQTYVDPDTAVTDPVTTGYDPGEPVSADPTSKPCRFETADCQKRTSSADHKGNELKFKKGDAVMGSYIKFSNGVVRENCFFPEAPYGGIVYGGVVHYWDGPEGNEGKDNTGGRCKAA